MHGCVVDQKLPYLYSHIYMCSNACVLAVKVCMYVAHVFQNKDLILMSEMCSWHSVKRTETSGIKMVSTKTSRDVGMVSPIK